MSVRRRVVVLGLGLLALGAGCRSASERFLELAADRDLRPEVVTGTGFRHLLLSSARGSGATLHVYLDGDGVPWFGGYPAVDPTPRDPLVLDLLALDPGPAVYLGRPCYHGLSGERRCSAAVWTSARYSEEVVTSLVTAVRHVIAARGAERIVWLGYSGGGALAVLLAARVSETAAVVTVAANLDIDAWADQQRSSRLADSLNPARQPPLPAHVVQRHYVGGRDRTVPPEITRRAVPAGPGLILIPDYGHRCCWATLWPSILAELRRALSA
jgi:hypothetical protein